ncbi:MAG: ATP-binding protein [Bacteroidia bacterium]
MPIAIRYIILGVLFLPFATIGQNGWQNFHQFNIEDGLANDYVYDITQDQTGYMWFATASGLSRYDAYFSKNFTVEDGLANNNVRRLMFDHEGKLWVLTQTEMTCYDGKNFHKVGQEGIRIISFLEDTSGNLWFSTFRDLYKKGTSTPTDSVHHVEINSLNIKGSPQLKVVDAEGRVWIYSSEKKFSILEGNSLLKEIPLKYAPGKNDLTPATCLLRNGMVLYVSGQGLIHIRPDGEQIKVSDPIPGGPVTSVMEDREGNIWISTSRGAFLMKKNTEGTWKIENTFLNNLRVNKIFQDMEGNFWFATEGKGAFLLTANANEILNRNHRVLQNLGMENTPMQISDIRKNAAGYPALALSDGQIISLSDSIESNAPVTIDLRAYLNPDETIASFLFLNSGAILISTSQRICIWSDGRLKTLEGLKSNISTHFLSYTSKGDILIITDILVQVCPQAKLQAAFDNSTSDIVSLDTLCRIFHHAQTSVAALDVNDSLWFAWSGGLSSGDENKAQNYSEKEDIFRTTVSDIQPDGDSLVWIATRGNGVIVLRNKTDQVQFQPLKLEGNVCNSLFIDKPSKTVWVATNVGIGKISNYQFGQKPEVQWFDQKDGLVSNDARKIIKYHNDIFVLTSAGLTVFDEARIQKDEFRPPIFLTRITINEVKQELVNSYSYQAEGNQISIHYAGISFRNFRKLNYRHKLEGMGNSEGWKITDQPYISYQALSPGKYTVTIEAFSNNENYSPHPIVLSLNIKPAFYRTWWFNALILTVFILMLLFLFGYLSAERQRIQLEMTVKEKTQALTRKIEELARTNQDLEQFTYVASHDLKTPLRTVIGHLQLLELKYLDKLDEEGKSFVGYAVQGAKHMFNIINDLLEYTKLGPEETDQTEIELTDIVREVCINLQKNLDEKNTILDIQPLPRITGSAYQYELLLQNLIGNALKFNESEQPYIKISAEENPDYHIISVTDNGIGISEEYLGKIFEPFQRLNASAFPGTGIGLAICKRIAEVNGGMIWASSAPGKGTTFFFTIPKRPDTANSASP